MEVGDEELMTVDNREERDLGQGGWGHGAPKVLAHPQCFSGAPEVEAGRSGVQGHPGPVS